MWMNSKWHSLVEFGEVADADGFIHQYIGERTYKAGLHIFIVTLSNAAVDEFTSKLLSLAPDVDRVGRNEKFTFEDSVIYVVSQIDKADLNDDLLPL